jgi:hypothetical protein
MTESRAQLLARKQDIFAAIRLLEQDHQDGAMGHAAYQTARRRLEQQAAGVLERLDSLPEDPSEGERVGGASVSLTAVRPRRWVLGGAVSCRSGIHSGARTARPIGKRAYHW